MKKIRWKSMLAFLLAFVVVVSGVPTTQVKASDVQEENMDGENDTTEETKERSEDGTKANAPSNAGGSKSEDDGTKMDVEAEESEDETIGKSDEEAEEKDKKSEDETAGKSDGEVDKKSEDETDGKPDEEVEEDTEESEGETAAKPEEDTEESEGETGSKSDEEVEDKKSEDETNSKSDEEVEDKKSEDETNSKLDEEADEKSEVEGEIDSDGITLLSDGDITPPVIDESSIVFLEEGQEIVPGSDIHITFSGYDVESELSPENTKIDISIEDRAWFITASAIEKTDEDKNEYKVSFTFETYWESGEYEIDSITIGDTEKNINKIDFDENSRPKFTVSELVNESVVIKSITLSKDEIILNDKTTSDTIFVEIVAEGDGKDDSKPFHLEFEYQDSYGNTCTYPADVYYQLNDGLYKAQIECDFSYPTATTYTLVRVTLDMGGYSWTINGQDVLATDLSAINLEVTMDTEAVAPSIVEKLAGGEPVRQISLTHNGDFGFKASLTINVGSEHEGEFGNLYYHDNNGKLVFMNAGQIDGDGNVSLNFSHASDYVVVVGRDRTEEENKTEEESMHVEIVDEEAVMIEEEMKESGNDLIPVMIILIVVAAAAGIIFVKKNKK